MIQVARKRVQGDAFQDVVQEAMMILNSKLEQIKSDPEVLPYAFQILRNCIGNYYKKIRREQRVIEYSLPADVSNAAPEQDSDWQTILPKALARLKEDNPRCARLFEAVLENAGIEELQQLFDLTPENVYRTLYRCRARLKKILVEDMRIELP